MGIYTAALLCACACVPCLGVAVAGAPPALRCDDVRALVVRPENSWGAWDAVIYGALWRKGAEVIWGEPAALADQRGLAHYDLVATNIKRSFTPEQVEGLRSYLRAGGALYGSWGGPMGCPELLRMCGVRRTWSVWLKGMTLVESPLTQGIGEQHLVFPDFAGHARLGDRGTELVAIEPAGGIVVARDSEGRSLGVLSRYGKGRTAILGFGPENPKPHFRRADVADALFDNLLRWLLPDRRPGRPWSGVVQVSVPARAHVLGARVGPTPMVRRLVKTCGSLKSLSVDVSRVRPGRSVTIRVRYRPLPPGGNVERMIHLPWGALAALRTPAQAVDFLASMGATVVQPLLRGEGGHACYRGLPEDVPDRTTVLEYEGDYLAEFIEGCHRRGIKVIGGIYLDSRTPLARYPEVARLGRDGRPVGTACFHDPRAQEHNLRTVSHLLDRYRLDGIILDDNFEMGDGPGPCYCAYCKATFRAYCERRGIPPDNPATSTNEAIRRLWASGGSYWLDASRELASRVRAIAAAHGVPAGGWVEAGSRPVYLAGALDFLGGMVYACPALAARLPLSLLGQTGYVTLLWAPNRTPAELEAEAAQAIHVGAATIGFWVLADPEGAARPDGYGMEVGSRAAIRRAFGRAEAEWRAYYRDNLVTGDGRFAVIRARLGREELAVVVRNFGRRVERRVQGRVDLSATE